LTFQNIDNIIYFDDIDDSITVEFKKATDRSENCFNVFFVVPHVLDVNTEAEYYLIDHTDTLLNAIRGRLVVDRPRFLIVLKSQSLQFIQKTTRLEANTITHQPQPQMPLSIGNAELCKTSRCYRSYIFNSLATLSAANFNVPPPNIQMQLFPSPQPMLSSTCMPNIGTVPPPPGFLPNVSCPPPCPYSRLILNLLAQSESVGAAEADSNYRYMTEL
ncbi:hypothetical protein COOONC_22058, partial [Cooperia oncophora]